MYIANAYAMISHCTSLIMSGQVSLIYITYYEHIFRNILANHTLILIIFTNLPYREGKVDVIGTGHQVIVHYQYSYRQVIQY